MKGFIPTVDVLDPQRLVADCQNMGPFALSAVGLRPAIAILPHLNAQRAIVPIGKETKRMQAIFTAYFAANSLKGSLTIPKVGRSCYVRLHLL